MTRRRTTDARRTPSADTPALGHPPTRSARPDSRRAVERRQAEQRSARRRRGVIAAAGVAVVALAVVVIVAVTRPAAGPSAPVTTGTRTATAPGPEGIPLETGPVLAPASSSTTGQTVDGIQCDASEQVAYHVHSHLSIYVDGHSRSLPAGVGIVEPEARQTAAGAFYGASRCYYWLHVHAQDGVIHIESPSSATYTLGQFFDLWGQPLTADQVGPATGPLTVFVDGKRFGGDPRSIALGSHRDIQIDVGTPAPPPKEVDWSRSEL
jgi:hypothetical protein